ncbi:MAG: type II secretion system GspH family protein [Acidimicrobiia bacterium]|nr:type II secretion system GspH family protein [Acidimicrobiia bacterium]
MVVVLVIAILLAIAIPTFIATRHKADDRAAQVGARQGLSSELSYYSTGQQFTDDPATLNVETSLYRYVAAPSAGPREISLYVVDGARQRVVLGVRSDTGTCFYVDHDMAAAVTRYGQADVPACNPDAAAVGAWLPHW